MSKKSSTKQTKPAHILSPTLEKSEIQSEQPEIQVKETIFQNIEQPLEKQEPQEKSLRATLSPGFVSSTPQVKEKQSQDDLRTLARFRLVLGQFAEHRLPGALSAQYGRMDQMLDCLYGREYQKRGVRQKEGAKIGDSSPSVITVPDWIQKIRDLFPTDTCEVLTRHALERYQLTELVTDKETLAKLEPNYDLLKTLLTFKDMMKGEVLELARQIIRQVVDDLRKKLEAEIRPALWGKIDRMRRTRFQSSRNLNIKRTIRCNLQHYDQKQRKLLVRDLYFQGRVKPHIPWHIIMAIDCSGSMMDSVIYSAVMAGIFKALPSVTMRLLAFDTAVVDLSEAISDPVSLLMSVQLGGGTNIGGAMATCAGLVTQPTRTMVILVTDFCEGGSSIPLQTTIKRLRSEGVRVLGLAALDEKANPSYDRRTAEACADAGAEIGAMTPQHLANWVAQVLS